MSKLDKLTDEQLVQIARLVLEEPILKYKIVEGQEGTVKYKQIFDLDVTDSQRDVVEIDDALNVSNEYGHLCNMYEAYSFLRKWVGDE